MGEGGEVLRILTRLWSEDSSTSVSIEWQNQRREGRPKARPPKQKATRRDQHTKQNKGHQPNQHKPNKKGGKGQVLKNLTRLWPGSSSTLTRNKRNKPKNRTNPQIDTRQPNKVAHTAVREKGAIRGEGKGNNKLEALTVFSQKIQAQE